jgi:hypothetical protein
VLSSLLIAFLGCHPLLLLFCTGSVSIKVALKYAEYLILEVEITSDTKQCIYNTLLALSNGGCSCQYSEMFVKVLSHQWQ